MAIQRSTVSVFHVGLTHIYTTIGDILAEELSLATNGKKASLQLATAAKVGCCHHHMM